VIKVSKDLNDIPLSLREEEMDEIRATCIAEEKYLKRFKTRYKREDTKAKLKEIYSEKCVFCEQKVVKCIDNSMQDCTSTVEHYRPKSIYYWLAFSWDNLLLCCSKCNQNKDNNFELLNTKVEYDEAFSENIHSSTITYNDIENPKIINPEIESVIKKLSFNNGVISSSDMRVKYTIETCGLDREDLNEKRKKIIDEFVKKTKDRRLANKPIDDIVEDLKSDIISKDKEFIALRLWLLINYTSLIKPK